MFEKLVSFTKKVADLPDRPSSNPKAQFDAAPDEVRQYLNKLIDALTKTTSGDSGAKNIGATAITGLTGTDVQSLIESLKTYTETLVGKKQAGKIDTFDVAAGATYNATITYEVGKFSTTPFLRYSILNTSVEGAYTMAHSIKDHNKDGATIQFKNKGTATQYMIVYWAASDK